MRDMKNNMDVVQSLTPAVRTASANGSGVDLRGYNGAMVAFNFGAADFASTDEVYTPSVEESDDNSTFTAVGAADLEGTLAVAAANSVQRVGYKGSKRYIRAVLTIAGTTPSVASGAMVVRGIANQRPVS